MKTLIEDRHASPLGELVMLTDAGRLVYLDFADNAARRDKLLSARYREFEAQPGPPMRELRARLDDYFDGEWLAFHDLDFDPGGSEFQRAVWRGLGKIPCGSVATYKQVGRVIGRPKAARAIGAANARNPIAIVIPCHRVIGVDRRLRGYAGGIERQAWLLEHEAAGQWARPGEEIRW